MAALPHLCLQHTDQSLLTGEQFTWSAKCYSMLISLARWYMGAKSCWLEVLHHYLCWLDGISVCRSSSILPWNSLKDYTTADQRKGREISLLFHEHSVLMVLFYVRRLASSLNLKTFKQHFSQIWAPVIVIFKGIESRRWCQTLQDSIKSYLLKTAIKIRTIKSFFPVSVWTSK